MADVLVDAYQVIKRKKPCSYFFANMSDQGRFSSSMLMWPCGISPLRYWHTVFTGCGDVFILKITGSILFPKKFIHPCGLQLIIFLQKAQVTQQAV